MTSHISNKNLINFFLTNTYLFDRKIFPEFSTPFGLVKLQDFDQQANTVLLVLINHNNKPCFVSTTLSLFIEKYVLNGMFINDKSLISLYQHLIGIHNDRVSTNFN